MNDSRAMESLSKEVLIAGKAKTLPSSSPIHRRLKKVVLKVNLKDDREMTKAKRVLSTVQGTNSVCIDTREQKLTVVGDIDPVVVVSKLRKHFFAELLTVGPFKEEKEEEKKKDPNERGAELVKASKAKEREKEKKKDPNEQGAELVEAGKAYNHQPPLAMDMFTFEDLYPSDDEESFSILVRQLDRRKDFLLLIKSYSMTIERGDECEEWINEALKVLEVASRAEENTHASSNLEFDELLSLVHQLLDSDPLQEILDQILPRDMLQKIYGPDLEDITSLLVKVPDESLHKPEGIFDLAVNFSVHQILENIKSGYIHRIKVSGRGEKRVMQAMKDHPGVASLFAFVLCITAPESQGIIDIQRDIARQLGLESVPSDEYELRQELSEKLQNTRFLLLLEECQENVLVNVGIPVQKGLGAVVFTSKSIQTKMAVDVEIRTEDHLLSWDLFCRNVGEANLSSTMQQIAVRIVQECRGHLLSVVVMAGFLKNVTDVNSWELALTALSTPASPPIEGMDKILARALAFIWDATDNATKHCMKICASYPAGIQIDKVVSHLVKDGLVYSHDEGHFIIQHLNDTFLVEAPVGNQIDDRVDSDDEGHVIVQLRKELYNALVKFFLPDMQPVFLKESNAKLTGSTEEEEYNTKEIFLMDSKLSELPDSPKCPSLIALYLQRNYDLTIIPPLFFERMPLLQVLDLSCTSIKSLPESIKKLVALRKLLLRGCELFMVLPPHVGELNNLEELDLDETQIIHLPIEIGKLTKLKRLRVSFYGDNHCSKKGVQSNIMIPAGVISSLPQLTELSIDVNPDDKQWDAIVKAILEEIYCLKMLGTLNLYLSDGSLLEAHKMGSSSEPIYDRLSRFSLVVGHHKRRIISRVPDDVEAHFKKWDKCLKFVNGRDIPDEVMHVLNNATAFYLGNHATAVNLCEFGTENMRRLKFCILTECHKMQTIIDDRMPYRRDKYTSVLRSLFYLGIYYMDNLRSIREGPVMYRNTMRNLKYLAIHTCPKLEIIFTVDLLNDLVSLEELIIEDCPEVTCLVSGASCQQRSLNYLWLLRRISLLFLPKLVSIFGGLNIAPGLERIGFYYCPKLQSISTTELSSKKLEVIKGERKWWDEELKWSESKWEGSRPDHLNNIFSEIDEDKDVRTQFAEDGLFFHASGQE